MQISRKVILAALLSTSSFFSRGEVIKIGTMVPEGTSLSKNLAKMREDILKATENRVDLKFIWGGVGGDEPDVLRKIHVGQFQGGLFTAKTLSDIVGDIRILEIPFTFTSRLEAQAALNKMRGEFTKQFASKKFVDLGIYEFGEIFLVTKDEVKKVDDLKGKKLWLYQGDHLAEAFSKSLQLAPVSIPLPDVLTSLNTDIITAAYAPAIGIVALQWHTKIKYLIEPPFAYHFQGLVVSEKAFAKIKPADQAKVKEITQARIAEISDGNIEDAKAARAAVIKQGVQVLTWPASDVSRLKAVREDVLKGMIDKKVISKEMIQQIKG